MKKSCFEHAGFEKEKNEDEAEAFEPKSSLLLLRCCRGLGLRRLISAKRSFVSLCARCRLLGGVLRTCFQLFRSIAIFSRKIVRPECLDTLFDCLRSCSFCETAEAPQHMQQTRCDFVIVCVDNRCQRQAQLLCHARGPTPRLRDAKPVDHHLRPKLAQKLR